MFGTRTACASAAQRKAKKCKTLDSRPGEKPERGARKQENDEGSSVARY